MLITTSLSPKFVASATSLASQAQSAIIQYAKNPSPTGLQTVGTSIDRAITGIIGTFASINSRMANKPIVISVIGGAIFDFLWDVLEEASSIIIKLGEEVTSELVDELENVAELLEDILDQIKNDDDDDDDDSKSSKSTFSSTSSSSSSSSTESYTVVTPILDPIFSVDDSVISSLAQEILAEQELEACMTVASQFSLVGTLCSPATASPSLTSNSLISSDVSATSSPPSPAASNYALATYIPPSPAASSYALATYSPPPPSPSPAVDPSIKGTPLEDFGAKNGICTNGTQADFDAETAKECLASLSSQNWIDITCAATEGGDCPGQISACIGVTVESSGSNWHDPQDCYDGCVSCLAVAMDEGWNSAKCNIKAGLATCEIYYDLQPGAPSS